MLKLMRVMSKEEGFGLAGKIPTLRNNPGDLRHSPHSSHVGIDPEGIGIIDTIEHGWEDFERQIRLDAARGFTVEKFIAKFAPPNENNTSVYLEYVCHNMPCLPSTLLRDILIEESNG